MGDVTVAVSGGFDPIHPGHVAMIRAAAEIGGVVVILNSDDWLLRKKGFIFQTWRDRADILRALAGVVAVEPVEDSDGTVCEALARLRPRYFANGGDRTDENTPELNLCRQIGIKPLFGLGGGKAASSSAIATAATVDREWGSYTVLAEGAGYKVKRLVVKPFGGSSIQRHRLRSETWFMPDGTSRQIPAGAWHRIENRFGTPLEIIEVQTGICREDDIERC